MREGWIAGAEDRWAVGLVVLFAVLCLVVGLRTGSSVSDVDEVAYQRTLISMRAGEGYYDATRDALAAKEGAAPSQVRSIRPPTVFLLLRPWPEGAWRWLAAAAQVAGLVLAWRIGRSGWPLAGPVAVVLVGLWLVGASPLLYLHAELWGLPLALGGVLALRRGWWVWAAVLFGAATCTRELYAAFLVAGLVVLPGRRWAWGAVTTAVAALAALHWRLASRVLDPTGREAAFGRGRSLSSTLSSISPADRPVSWLVGVLGCVVGLVVLVRMSRAGSKPELAVLVAVVALLGATLVWGRTYWGLSSGPVLACYAAMVVAYARGSTPALPTSPVERGALLARRPNGEGRPPRRSVRDLEQ